MILPAVGSRLCALIAANLRTKIVNVSELRWVVCRANVSSAHRVNSPAGDVSLRVLRSTRVLI